MFVKGSRYERVPDAIHVDATGRQIRYKTVRFIGEATPVTGHRVVAGERLDHIANSSYRDPERYWRICDANRASWPDDLLEVGAVIGIPAAEE
jgi:nucleoid-associated protein YgaU